MLFHLPKLYIERLFHNVDRYVSGMASILLGAQQGKVTLLRTVVLQSHEG